MDVGSSLKESIEVRSVTGRGETGNPTYAAAVTVKARVERLTETASASDGTTTVENHRLFTVTELRRSDRVYLAGEDSSDVDDGHALTRVETMKDLDGLITHYESYF